MSGETCPREGELLDALGRGFVGAELAAHVASCPSCGELSVVAGALLEDRAQAIVEAPIPSAGTMWWRLQVRRRQEAEATARRSLLIGQAVTLAVAIGLVVSFFGAHLAFTVRDWLATLQLSTPLLLALAASILAVPIAGWVALRQQK
jgi:predicted anti-sigma-YlaC factor YlaD